MELPKFVCKWRIFWRKKCPNQYNIRQRAAAVPTQITWFSDAYPVISLISHTKTLYDPYTFFLWYPTHSSTVANACIVMSFAEHKLNILIPQTTPTRPWYGGIGIHWRGRLINAAPDLTRWSSTAVINVHIARRTAPKWPALTAPFASFDRLVPSQSDGRARSGQNQMTIPWRYAIIATWEMAARWRWGYVGQRNAGPGGAVN